MLELIAAAQRAGFEPPHIFTGEVVYCGACKGEGLAGFTRDDQGRFVPRLCSTCNGAGRRVLPGTSVGLSSKETRALLARKGKGKA